MKLTAQSDLTSNLSGLFVQMLLRRFECERNSLEAKTRSQTCGYPLANSACCTVIPEIINCRRGYETWMETLPIVDETSLLLDLFLLQDLSEIVLSDPKDLQLVMTINFNFLSTIKDT